MNLSFLGGGLWFIPLVTLLGALYSYYRGYKQSKGGSLETYAGGATRESDENIPFYKCTGTIYGYILTAMTIGILLLMYSDR